MKKIAIALTAALMVLSLAACDKTDPDQVDKTPIKRKTHKPSQMMIKAMGMIHLKQRKLT